MSREIKIERIEPDGDIVKMSHAYGVPVVLVLADGQRYRDQRSRRLLREARAYAAKLPMQPENETWAMFSEDGRYIGQRVRIRIGGGR